jgi:hypothetical protein
MGDVDDVDVCRVTSCVWVCKGVLAAGKLGPFLLLDFQLHSIKNLRYVQNTFDNSG